MAGDLAMLSVCDAMVMVPGWETSAGAREEWGLAKNIGLPVYVYPDLPPLHPTEVKNPKQVMAFRGILGQMYRVHLDKNADYSPSNINGAGLVGLSTRIWDKAARLMNLHGYPVEAVGEHDALFALFIRVVDLMKLTGFRQRISVGSLRSPKTPKNEPLNDAYLDIAVYGIIGLLRRKGLWGK